MKPKELPKGIRHCWYINETDRADYKADRVHYGNDYIPSEYFFIKKNSPEIIEGYLGRTDRPQQYFFRSEPGISYFDDYDKGKAIYFSFDRTNLYEVVSILPENYLLFVLKRVNPESTGRISEDEKRSFYREIMLLDFKDENPEYRGYVEDFNKRQTIAGYFLSTEEFIENEINAFKENIKIPMIGIVQVNNMPPVEPFNVSAYSFKAYEYLRKGHNLQIKQLVINARRECENAKKEQLKKFGSLIAWAPCEGESFDEQVRFAIRRGVGFALYVKYLQDQLPIQESLDRPLNIQHFDSIFQSPNVAEICKAMLEDMEITLGGKSRLTPGKSGILAAAIMAIKETPGILNRDSLTDLELLAHFNAFLGTTFRSVPKRSKSHKSSLDDAKRFLKNALKN